MEYLDLANASAEYKLAAGRDYLAGFDAPVDHVKGLALIRSAAEAGLPEAMEELAVLYRRGVAEDPEGKQEVFWLGKLSDLAEEEYFREYHEELGWRCIRYLVRLVEACLAAGDLPGAKNACQRWVRLAEDMQERYFHYTLLAGARIRMGDLEALDGNMGLSRSHYQAVMAMLEQYDYRPAWMGRRVCLQKMTQTHRWYHVDIPQEIWLQLAEAEERISQMEILPGMDRGVYEEPYWSAAIPMRCGLPQRKSLWLHEHPFYTEMIEKMEDYVAQKQSAAAEEDFAERLMEYSAVAREYISAAEAKKAAEKAFAIWEKRYQRRGNAVYQVLMARCLQQLGLCQMMCGMPSEVDRYFVRAYGLLTDTKDPALKQRGLRQLVDGYHKLEEFYRQWGLQDDAQRYQKKAALMAKKIEK